MTLIDIKYSFIRYKINEYGIGYRLLIISLLFIIIKFVIY